MNLVSLFSIAFFWYKYVFWLVKKLLKIGNYIWWTALFKSVFFLFFLNFSLNYLSTYGFYVRGVPVKVVDITHDSVVICLTGVPHYITDSTITMLVSTFGIAIGEVERRFYKGVDTGERYVRLKPRAHTQVPDFVTVGGCKILIRVLSNEEVCPPYTLQSQVRNNHFRRTKTLTSFL